MIRALQPGCRPSAPALIALWACPFELFCVLRSVRTMASVFLLLSVGWLGARRWYCVWNRGRLLLIRERLASCRLCDGCKVLLGAPMLSRLRIAPRFGCRRSCGRPRPHDNDANSAKSLAISRENRRFDSGRSGDSQRNLQSSSRDCLLLSVGNRY